MNMAPKGRYMGRLIAGDRWPNSVTSLKIWYERLAKIMQKTRPQRFTTALTNLVWVFASNDRPDQIHADMGFLRDSQSCPDKG